MSRQLHLLFVVLLLLSASIVAHSMPSNMNGITLDRQKRGFRNSALATARGFGKRTPGEMPQLLEDLGIGDISFTKAVPASWFAEQVNRNPALAKFIVDKILDANGDGFISPDELY